MRTLKSRRISNISTSKEENLGKPSQVPRTKLIKRKKVLFRKPRLKLKGKLNNFLATEMRLENYKDYRSKWDKSITVKGSKCRKEWENKSESTKLEDQHWALFQNTTSILIITEAASRTNALKSTQKGPTSKIRPCSKKSWLGTITSRTSSVFWTDKHTTNSSKLPTKTFETTLFREELPSVVDDYVNFMI